jgi:hypothetical protein
MANMKSAKIVSGIVIAVVAAGLLAGRLHSDDKKAQEKPDPAMEAMIKAGTPGESHKLLEPLAGSWDVAGKFWMQPDAPPTESPSTCQRKWILGGRFLQEDVQGTFMDMPFQGLGFVGYDNVKKAYVSTWMDSMSTCIATSSGTADPSGKRFNFKGEYSDPATGKDKKTRTVITIDSKDKHKMEMFETGPDGKEQKSLEMVLSRKR